MAGSTESRTGNLIRLLPLPGESLGAAETMTRSQLISLPEKEMSDLSMFLFPHLLTVAKEREPGSEYSNKPVRCRIHGRRVLGPSA